MLFFKKLLFFLLPTLLFCETLHKKEHGNNTTKKIQCRWVCDTKLYKEKKIAKAISFYKKSKYYKFKTQ